MAPNSQRAATTATIEARMLGLLRVRWPRVGSRDPGAPFQKLFAGVVLVRDHLDEAQGVILLLQSRLYRCRQLLLALHLKVLHDPSATIPQGQEFFVSICHEQLRTFAVQHLPSPLWMASTRPV